MTKKQALLKRAATIARRPEHQWCDPKRVSKCYGCACRKEARAELRKASR
jgi:hypothetical protein